MPPAFRMVASLGPSPRLRADATSSEVISEAVFSQEVEISEEVVIKKGFVAESPRVSHPMDVDREFNNDTLSANFQGTPFNEPLCPKT